MNWYRLFHSCIFIFSLRIRIRYRYYRIVSDMICMDTSIDINPIWIIVSVMICMDTSIDINPI
jgi:hypothetical protein